MHKISLVINTLNEESNISDCIKSAGDTIDEVIVCDMYSDDSTVEIAKSCGAEVVFHDRVGFVEPARHFAISKAKYEWVLVLDADERMTDVLMGKLQEIVKKDKSDLVTFYWLNEYFGDYLIESSFRVPRFFRKKIYMKYYTDSEIEIHKNFRILEEKVSNKIELSTDYYLIHHAYPTIEKYVVKTIGMYARIEAEEMHKNGVKFSVSKLILDPVKTFFRNYFIKGGYKNKVRGFIKTVLFSGYRFSVWSNLWLIEETKMTGNE